MPERRDMAAAPNDSPPTAAPAPASGRRRDALCRFYTRPAACRALADLVGGPSPDRLLDLASGGGALLQAASLRWTLGEAVSVDIDPAARPPAVASRRQRHVVADVLDPGLPSRLGTGGFDIVLCNPPYLRLPRSDGRDRILAEAGLSLAYPGRREAGAEAVVVAQALRLARPGGRLGLVVPDGLVSGRLSTAFREAILARHAVRHVMQLAPGAFRATEARAFLMVIEKDAGPTRTVLLHGACGGVIPVSSARAALRMDHGHHAVPSGTGTLASLGAEIARGSLETVEARGFTGAVFHTVDFPEGMHRAMHALPPAGAGRTGRPVVMAGPGDILVARLHRRLHLKVCGIASGSAALTSAVLRIRVPVPARDGVLAALLSDEGAARLAATARGTGPRMLGKADLLAMALPGQRA